MSGKSSAELELEAEAARARVAETASNIRSKLTAGQMFDEFSGMVTGGDLSQGFERLKSQVRENPLPLTLIGAGIALLALGPRGGSIGDGLGSLVGGWRSANADHSGPAEGVTSVPRMRGTAAAGAEDDSDGLGGTVKHAARSAAAGVQSATDAARSSVRAAGERVADGASDLMDTADRLGHEMLTGTARRAKTATSAASQAIEQEPLAIGALGLVLGAVLGATLPVSEFEEEHLGPHARKLRQGAEDLAERGLKGAGDVASKAYETVREEADRQGLSPGDGETLSARVGEVAKAAAEEIDRTVRSGLEPHDETRSPGSR